MIQWKQIDTLPYRIPCEWSPRLCLDRSCGSVKLYRLRLPARFAGEDLILRIKRGSFRKLWRTGVDYQRLKLLADDLKAIATTLGFVPVSEQKKIKSMLGWDAVPIQIVPQPPPTPVPADFAPTDSSGWTYSHLNYLNEIYRYWWVTPSQGQGTSGPRDA